MRRTIRKSYDELPLMLFGAGGGSGAGDQQGWNLRTGEKRWLPGSENRERDRGTQREVHQLDQLTDCNGPLTACADSRSPIVQCGTAKRTVS